MEKVVVVAPSISDFYFTPGRASSLGAREVDKSLKRDGIDSIFLNLPLYKPRGINSTLPEELRYLVPYIVKGERGPLAYFSKYKCFGLNPSDSAELIISKNPSRVIISLFAFAYGSDAVKLAAELRKIVPDHDRLKIDIGGAGVSVYPEYFFNTGLFNNIFTNEWNSGNSTPEPAIEINKDSKNRQWISTILSRGCPMKCTFCSNHLTQGREFRTVSQERLREELDKIEFDSRNPIHINLEDDNLLIRKSYFFNILKEFKTKFPNATFSIDNGLDYTLMNLETVDFLIDIGFNRFTFSLATSSLKLLNRIERPADLKKFETLLKRIKERGVHAKTFFICGLPGDSPQNVVDTLAYLHNCETEAGISMFYPVPGLPGFEDKSMFNGLTNLCCGSSAYPWAGTLTTEEMVTMFRLSRLSNLIKKSDKSLKEEKLIKTIINNKELYTFIGKTMELVPVPNQNRLMVKRFIESSLILKPSL